VKLPPVRNGFFGFLAMQVKRELVFVGEDDSDGRTPVVGLWLAVKAANRFWVDVVVLGELDRDHGWCFLFCI